MAKFFSESDIDLFKECFFFTAKKGYTTNVEELALIMRSLSYSPTMEEVQNYFEKYVRDGKIDFASFLEAMHDHSERENTVKEIMNAFRAHDKHNSGYVSAAEARNILTKIGEGMSRQEVDFLYREGNVTGGQLRYRDFIDNISTPAPDY